jgi:hypothetical protein
MKSFKHWTPRYIVNRLRTIYYAKTCPGHPWLTRTANEILDSYLTSSDIGLEFGSGRSTIWLARRVARLVSVEHDSHWAAKVREMLRKENINSVNHSLVPMDREEDQGKDAAYVGVIDSFQDNSLDFCLVDGVYRGFCARRVMEKLRPGGVLIIDNVNWYLPHPTYSPESRSLADGPKGVIWQEVDHLISDWRRIWTSSGVTDTAFFFKPCPKPQNGV